MTADAGAQPLAVDGAAYRGSLTVERSDGSLSVVNTVPLERYVRSVVPSELQQGWQQQAYRAQAVAARSYAVASIRPAAPFDLYADARSQIYDGIASGARRPGRPRRPRARRSPTRKGDRRAVRLELGRPDGGGAGRLPGTTPSPISSRSPIPTTGLRPTTTGRSR